MMSEIMWLLFSCGSMLTEILTDLERGCVCTPWFWAICSSWRI